MQVSALQLVAMVAPDELVNRFASRALIATIGQDRADSATSVITVADLDAAIGAIESPSMDDHVKNAALFGADPEESFMRDAHAASSAAHVLADIRRFAR